VRLGGRNVYGGRVEDRPVLGDGPDARDPDAADLERAARLSLRVGSATAVLCAAVALLRGRRSR
jgi:adenosylcobinamide-phosphate synthase